MRETLLTSAAAIVLLMVLGLLVLVSGRDNQQVNKSVHSVPVANLSKPESIAQNSIEERIRAAQAGDVLVLSGENYGSLVLNGVHFDSPVIIDGLNEATFKTISLQNVTNLHFRRVRVVAGTTQRQASDLAVNIMRSRHIRFEDSDISWQADTDWTNDGVGMTARLSQDVAIKDNLFHYAFIGLVIRDADDILIKGNTFEDIRRDGINVSGTVNIEIDHNTCTNFHPTRPLDHPDCIQFWNDTAIRSNENIRITNNNILRGSGGVSQGIFISGQKEGLHHKNMLIENNIVHQAMGQAIYVQKAEDVIVRNNHISPAPPVEFRPMLTVRNPVRDVLLEGNTMPWLDIAPDVVSEHITRIGNTITE